MSQVPSRSLGFEEKVGWEGQALIEFRVDGQVGRESFEKEGLTEDVW